MIIHTNIVFEQFRKKKTLTLSEITSLLNCSERTTQRRLRDWEAYTSYNCNGRYYTLRDVPQFDNNGIWQYKNVYFSQHGTLQKTLQYLVEHSEAGLNIIEANEILKMEVQDILSKQFINHSYFYREKHKGLYIYYSQDSLMQTMQKQARHAFFKAVAIDELPTDAEAVIILVEFIKHPNDTVKQLAARVRHRKQKVSLNKIHNLLLYHDLLKKTLEQGH